MDRWPPAELPGHPRGIDGHQWQHLAVRKFRGRCHGLYAGCIAKNPRIAALRAAVSCRARVVWNAAISKP